MLTSEQKRYLKNISMTLLDKYQVGKNGITDNLVCMLDKALTAKELIKIDVMKNLETPMNELAFDLSSKLNADIVQIVGRTITLYRKNKEKPKIKLK